jgi:hypothetical protein
MTSGGIFSSSLEDFFALRCVLITGYSDFRKKLKIAMLFTCLNQWLIPKTISKRHFTVFRCVLFIEGIVFYVQKFETAASKKKR